MSVRPFNSPLADLILQPPSFTKLPLSRLSLWPEKQKSRPVSTRWRKGFGLACDVRRVVEGPIVVSPQIFFRPSRSLKTVVQPPVPFASQQRQIQETRFRQGSFEMSLLFSSRRQPTQGCSHVVSPARAGFSTSATRPLGIPMASFYPPSPQPRYSNLIVALPQLPCHLRLC